MAQLAETSYVSTAASGSDNINVVVGDGEGINTTKTLTITSQGPLAPIVSAHSTTLPTSAAFTNFSSLFTATDPNGVSLSGLTYTLSYTGSGGTLDIAGSPEAQASNLTLSASDLSTLGYTPSVYGGTDQFTLTVSDGLATSAKSTFTITSPSSPGPVLTPTGASVSVSRDQVISNLIPQLWTETDAYPNATISQYEFYDSDASGGLGSFLEGSVVKTADPNDKIIPVSAAYLSTIVYQGISGSQVLYARANDGTYYTPHWGRGRALP
jgi:hypothetical protein